MRRRPGGGGALGSGNPVNALPIATATAAHRAFGRLVVEDGDAAHFAAARLGTDMKFFSPCTPVMEKEFGLSALDAISRRAAFFSCIEQRRQRRLGQTKSLDLNLPLRESPAAAGA